MAAARRHSGPGAGSQQPSPHRGPPAAAKYPDAPPERQTPSWEKGGRGGGGRGSARRRTSDRTVGAGPLRAAREPACDPHRAGEDRSHACPAAALRGGLLVERVCRSRVGLCPASGEG